MPTILVYGHYDVQPPDPLEAWASPPFEPTLHADRYVARGASDDKSPLWIALSGLEAWLAVTGGLPLNVKVLLEEAGSRMEHICKITTYITDRAYREPVYQVVGRHLGNIAPVGTGLIVNGLALPEMLVEIDIDAVIPEGEG